MSVYDQFGTSKEREAEGVGVDFGDFRVKLARAGGHNQKWAKVAERCARPYKTAIQAGTLSNEKATELMADLYVEAVVMDWQTKRDDEWVDGIEGRDGELMPFTKENVKKILIDLPDLFAILQQHATDLNTFKEQQLIADAKN